MLRLSRSVNRHHSAVPHATCDWPQGPRWHKLFMSLPLSQFALEHWNSGQTFMSWLVALFWIIGR